MNKLTSILVGVASSSVATGVAIYIRDIYSKDWSGFGPAYKIGWIPIFFALGFVIAIFSNILVCLVSGVIINNLRHQYIIGLASGFVGIGSFLTYWLGNVELVSVIVVSFIVVCLTFIFSFNTKPMSSNK